MRLKKESKKKDEKKDEKKIAPKTKKQFIKNPKTLLKIVGAGGVISVLLFFGIYKYTIDQKKIKREQVERLKIEQQKKDEEEAERLRLEQEQKKAEEAEKLKREEEQRKKDRIKRQKEAREKAKEDKPIDLIDLFFRLNVFFDLDKYEKKERFSFNDEQMETWRQWMKAEWAYEDDGNKEKYETVCKKNGWEHEKGMEEGNYREIFAVNCIRLLKKNFVTWEQWKEKIKALGEELAAKIRKAANAKKEKNKLKSIYFLIPGVGKKSNTWVFFLIWKYIRKELINNKDIKCHFISLAYKTNRRFTILDELSEYCEANLPEDQRDNYTKKNAMVCVFDDASYSGNQLYSDIKGTRTIFKTGRIKNFYVIAPYMSWLSKRALRDMQSPSIMDEDVKNLLAPKGKESFESPYVKFMDTTQEFEGFYCGNLSMARNDCWHPVIFEHKLPDDVSGPRSVASSSKIYLGGDTWRQEVWDKFEPKSFFNKNGAPHAYTKEQQAYVMDFFRNQIKAANNDNFKDKNLPIPTLYKYRDYIYENALGERIIISSKENGELFTKGIVQTLLKARTYVP